MKGLEPIIIVEPAPNVGLIIATHLAHVHAPICVSKEEYEQNVALQDLPIPYKPYDLTLIEPSIDGYMDGQTRRTARRKAERARKK